MTHDLREAVFLANTVYVMSKRPGRLVHVTHIDLPRPRTLEHMFQPEFTNYVHEIYNRIGEVRA